MFSNFYGAINIPNTRNRGLSVKYYGEYVAISYYNTSNKKNREKQLFLSVFFIRCIVVRDGNILSIVLHTQPSVPSIWDINSTIKITEHILNQSSTLFHYICTKLVKRMNNSRIDREKEMVDMSTISFSLSIRLLFILFTNFVQI